MTKTIEVSDELADELENATSSEVGYILVKAAQDFIDVTEIGSPRGHKELIHIMTGRKLHLNAVWDN